MSANARRVKQERFELQLARTLLDRSLVTAEQLEQAVRQQVVLGGHLATNLWELGYTSGKKLTQTSAELLGVPLADPSAVATAEEAILKLLSREFVQRSRLIPFAVEGSTLRVASCEPWDLQRLGEAARESGYPIEPYFLAEVPLMALLAKVYYISPGARFGRGFQHGKRHTPRSAATPADTAEGQAGRSSSPKPKAPEAPPSETTVRGDASTSRSRRPAAPLGGVSPLRILEKFELAGGEAVSAQHAPPAAVVQPSAEQVPTPPEARSLDPIGHLATAQQKLDQAGSRDGVGEALLRFALSRGNRVALFVLRGDHWSGWTGAGPGVAAERIRSLSLPAAAGSIFGIVSETGGHHLGPLGDHPVHHTLLETLQDPEAEAVPPPPRSAALLPVHLGQRLVFGIYVDGGPGRLVSAQVADVMALGQRVPQVLRRLMEQRVRKRFAAIGAETPGS